MKQPISPAALLHIYPVSCFIGDVPLIGYAKLSSHFFHLVGQFVGGFIIDLGVFGRHFVIESSAGIVWAASRKVRGTLGGLYPGTAYLRLYEYSLCI